MRANSLAAAALISALVVSTHVNAAEITVFSPGSTEAALSKLMPQFEKSSGHKVTVKYGPVGVLADRLSKGQPADVAILSAPAIEKLLAQGTLAAGSEVAIAKVGIGVFVRKGDPKPDISSVDAFTRSLAAAKSIAYANPALGGSTSILIVKLMDSLDATGSIKAKTKFTAPAKPLLDLIASGGADFGFNPIAEIMPDPRVELVGPLPAPMQKYSRYVAALVASSRQQNAFKALMSFLTSPAAGAVMEANGFQRP